MPDFTRARVLVVGDVMLDRYWFGDVSRISPEAPVPVVHVMRTRGAARRRGQRGAQLHGARRARTLLSVVGRRRGRRARSSALLKQRGRATPACTATPRSTPR